MEYNSHEELYKLQCQITELQKQIEQVKLKEDEIDLIVDKVCNRLEAKLYHDVGQGVLAFAFKAFIVGVIALAAYGAGIKSWFGH